MKVSRFLFFESGIHINLDVMATSFTLITFQQGGLFNRKVWMFHNVPWLVNSTELFLMLPVAFVSGILYLQVIRALKKGKVTARKITLTRAFCALWICWIMCVFPYEVLDIYFLSIDRMGYGYYIAKPSEISFAVSIFARFQSDSAEARMLIIESVLQTLRHSYSFLNSVLLLVLVRPFSEPLKSAFKMVSCRK